MEISEPHFFYSVGSNIRKIRVKYGYTLEQLSKMIGISVPDLEEIEAGMKMISIEEFIIIAKTLNIPPSSLSSQFECD